MFVYKLCVKKDGKLVSMSATYQHSTSNELPRRFIRTYEVGRWTQSPRTIARRRVAPLFCFRTLEEARKSHIFPCEPNTVILKCVARGIRKQAVMSDQIDGIPDFWDIDAPTPRSVPVNAPPGTVLCESVFPIEVVCERDAPTPRSVPVNAPPGTVLCESVFPIEVVCER